MIGRTFASLRVPNYRRYFTGQVISITGNWMQIVGEMWLMVKLTGSGVSVGLTAGLQFLPILLFGAWGGLLADRMPKRTLLTITQLSMAVPALTMFGLSLSGLIEPWMVLALVLLRGSVLALDNPARQSFVVEIVGPDRVLNAVALNSVVVHTARILGPAAAGIAIAVFGISWCFLLNALSFLAMFVALRAMDPSKLETPKLLSRRRGDVAAALRYVRRTPDLLIPLVMMALVGTISFNFQVLLPLLADFTWNGTAATYASMTAAMGVGSVAGALAAGARGRVSPQLLVFASLAFGAFDAAGRGGADARTADLGPRAAGRRERHVRRGGELRAADRRRADHARARDVAVLDRLPRLDADRRAARRVARGDRGAARRAPGRRVRGAVCRGRGVVRVSSALG